MRILSQTLKENIPAIKEAAKREKLANQRTDDMNDLMAIVQQAFMKMNADVEKRVEAFGLRQKIGLMANMTRKLSVKEWKKAVKSTLGIDLLDDYYLGEFYRSAMEQWVDKNVSLISTIPKDTLRKMKDLVQGGYTSGKTTTFIIKQIQREYSIEKRHARLIARDQIAKLNGDMGKQQQEDAGVDEYIWSTSGDSRVRERHKDLNRKRFRWNDPPVVDLKTGRRCHPGEDYECRCVALPVFNIESIKLPWYEEGGG